MEKKILFGTLGATVAGFLVSMVFMMGLMKGMADEWMKTHASCLNEMNPVWWIVAGVIVSLFLSILLHRFGVNTFKGGAVAGSWIMLFIVLFYGISNASTYTAYPWSWLPYDVVINVITGAVAGGVIGWIYGKVK